MWAKTDNQQSSVRFTNIKFHENSFSGTLLRVQIVNDNQHFSLNSG